MRHTLSLHGLDDDVHLVDRPANRVTEDLRTIAHWYIHPGYAPFQGAFGHRQALRWEDASTEGGGTMGS